MEKKSTMQLNGLDVFDITISDEEDRMLRISLVDNPAVEKDFLKFKEETPLICFAKDEMEHCLTGVAIRANMPIYRRSGDYEYYVRFDKDTIKEIVEKYSKEGLFNKVDLQHDGEEVSGVYMVEMFLKDTSKGISPKGFEDIEEGSLFVTYKIDNEALWKEIMESDNYNGFSIEMIGTPVPVVMSSEEEQDIELDVDVLLGDKKKVDFASVEELLGDKTLHDIATPRKTLRDAQVYAIGEQNGNKVAIIYADSPYKGRKQWYIYPLKDIGKITPSSGAFTPWTDACQGSSWKGVEDLLDDVTVTKSAEVASTDIKRLIDEGYWVIINYNDGQDHPHTLARQCMIVAWGVSKTGEECLRIYEKYGDSRSATSGDGEIPDYRLLLTKRITQIRVIDYMERWDASDLDWRYNWSGDNGMASVYHWYH